MDHNRLPLVHPMDLSYQDLDFVRIHLFLLLPPPVEEEIDECAQNPNPDSLNPWDEQEEDDCDPCSLSPSSNTNKNNDEKSSCCQQNADQQKSCGKGGSDPNGRCQRTKPSNGEKASSCEACGGQSVKKKDDEETPCPCCNKKDEGTDENNSNGNTEKNNTNGNNDCDCNENNNASSCDCAGDEDGCDCRYENDAVAKCCGSESCCCKSNGNCECG